MIKKRSGLFTAAVSAFLIILFSPFCSPAASEEKIISFHSDITVHRDASLTVKETIRVKAEGEKIKHGIYRDFPVSYRDSLGNSYVVGFNLKEVLSDGRSEPYNVEGWSNGKRVYIGDKNTLLAPGEYTYTLVYGTDHQLGFFSGYDELYWNVTGNDWDFPIDEATASVELPDVYARICNLRAHGLLSDCDGIHQFSVLLSTEGPDPRRQASPRCDKWFQGLPFSNRKGQDESVELPCKDT